MTDPTTSTIGRRLKLQISRHKVTVADLARHAGVKSSFIHDIISGKSTNPSPVKLALVAAALDIELAALVQTTGAPMSRLRQPDAGDSHVSIPHLSVEQGRVVSKTQPADACWFRRSWITDHLGASPGDMRLMRVLGDSMEPTLWHNDLLLVDTTRRSPSPPGVFVVFDGVGLVPKRLEYTPHKTLHIRVGYDNSRYSGYERSTAEIMVVGRVAWIGRAL
jgi:phage repressor protein C with HTH and peptisase S24 domain